jgi:hypothetical protein
MTTASPGPTTLRFEPDQCANCFEPLPADDKHLPVLFCSGLCQDYAATIRYWRNAGRVGSLATDPGVPEAISTTIADLLACGYNARARRIPSATRALVIERDKVCVNCGRPGEEIDHIDGDSNDPGNLQFLCTDCHHTKTQSHMVPASSEQIALIDAIEKTRVMPPEPAQLCDDETFWSGIHRQLARERIARLRGTEPGNGARGLSSEEILNDIAARAHLRPGFSGAYDDDDYEARGEDDDSGYGEDSYFARAMGKED